MKENTIVSLADEKYFDLLLELIESIEKFFKKGFEAIDLARCP